MNTTGKANVNPRMTSLEQQGYEGFRRLAKEDKLSKYEKIGFPDSYRDGFEEAIFSDILAKLPRLGTEDKLHIMDIGPGCSDLPRLLINLCQRQAHQLTLVDSPEMLSLLPDAPYIRKLAGYFPDEHTELLRTSANSVDIIIIYSVLHYVYAEGNVFNFLDATLSLLADGGLLLIGDIPNISKRKRFFSSKSGIAFHQDYTKSDSLPDVHVFGLEPGNIDDAVVLGLMSRARLAGYDAFLLPQPGSLSMSNRREDLLFYKP